MTAPADPNNHNSAATNSTFEELDALLAGVALVRAYLDGDDVALDALYGAGDVDDWKAVAGWLAVDITRGMRRLVGTERAGEILTDKPGQLLARFAEGVST